MESGFPGESIFFIAQEMCPTNSEALKKKKLSDLLRNPNENNDQYFHHDTKKK
jgi:hypothetical protein